MSEENQKSPEALHAERVEELRAQLTPPGGKHPVMTGAIRVHTVRSPWRRNARPKSAK